MQVREKKKTLFPRAATPVTQERKSSACSLWMGVRHCGVTTQVIACGKAATRLGNCSETHVQKAVAGAGAKVKFGT